MKIDTSPHTSSSFSAVIFGHFSEMALKKSIALSTTYIELISKMSEFIVARSDILMNGKVTEDFQLILQIHTTCSGRDKDHGNKVIICKDIERNPYFAALHLKKKWSRKVKAFLSLRVSLTFFVGAMIWPRALCTRYGDANVYTQ
ncbi:hypothetical protein HAX54_042834 [Datura stramonium]|uniref:Uncharacterized protein n=1 Tax=Datura stramonium TaxID=4076 RepID=A0ABS8W1Z2_DATST|nr:hypothetical protein [Datura stramonium]